MYASLALRPPAFGSVIASMASPMNMCRQRFRQPGPPLLEALDRRRHYRGLGQAHPGEARAEQRALGLLEGRQHPPDREALVDRSPRGKPQHVPEIGLLRGVRGPIGIPDLVPVALGVHLPRESSQASTRSGSTRSRRLWRARCRASARVSGDHWPRKRWMASFGSGVCAMRCASASEATPPAEEPVAHRPSLSDGSRRLETPAGRLRAGRPSAAASARGAAQRESPPP